MKSSTRKIAGLMAGGALVVAGAPAIQSAVADEVTAPADRAATLSETTDQARTVSTETSIENVQGTFGWNQGVTTDNETLAKVLYRGSTYLCGSLADETTALAAGDHVDRAGIRFIKVSGDVGSSFNASVDEYLAKAPAKKIMGCTCFGNPSDGRASANAEVSGFKLSALINEAAPADGANTITFISADGYKIALPLSYVTQRYSIIATDVNGDTTESALGCANQLWLGSTSARSFARDVVEIAVTKEVNPPAAPGANPDANLPNIGVTEGRATA